MIPLWSAEDAAAATGGRIVGDWSCVSGVSIDTRELSDGDLFVALIGDNRDGHEFVFKAISAGAGAALVSRVPDGLNNARLLVVDDTLRALEQLAAAARARTDAKVIAVTGSVGKTSTKEMLRAMLAPQGRTHAAVRSFNNHWGVPLTLARMPADTEFAVIEIGMNHAGEIYPLSRLARPHVAMITAVEAVHLEAFNSVAEIADAKAEIFAGLEPGGAAILPADNPYFDRLMSAASGRNVLTFGKGDADLRMTAIEILSESTTFALDGGYRGLAEVGTAGAHFAMNAVGALLAVKAAGVDIEDARIALKAWSPPAGRGQKAFISIASGPITLLDESYNANPASMTAALAVLAASESAGRRQAFLGDMLELGPTEMDLHAQLADDASMGAIETVHCCGPRMKALYDALAPEKRGLWCVDSVQLAKALPGRIDGGDTCMVKGSLGAKMAIVVEAIKALGTATDNRDA